MEGNASQDQVPPSIDAAQAKTEGDVRLACPIRTGPPLNDQNEIRGYKLGKQKFSYNAITLLLQDAQCLQSVTSAVEVPVDQSFNNDLKHSCLKYDLYLGPGGELLTAYVFLVFAAPLQSASSESSQYWWEVVTRKDCLRGCSGPMLQGIRRYGKAARWTVEERDDRAKDPSKLYIAIDEACAHLEHRDEQARFRLVLGLYSGTKEVATAVSGVIRILANNDAPKGAASFDLVCNMNGPDSAQPRPAERPVLQELTNRLQPKKEKKAVNLLRKPVPPKPTASKARPSSGPADPVSSRGGSKALSQQITLSAVVDRLLKLYGQRVGSILSLGSLARELGATKRRIYDVMNVLESVHFVRRCKGPDLYVWQSASNLQGALDALMFGSQTNQSAAGLREDQVEEEGMQAKASSDSSAEARPSKSLRFLSEGFVRLLLKKQGQVALLNEAVTTLAGDVSESAHSTRKRLGDIANVLSSLHLIVKLQGAQGPGYVWLGGGSLPERGRQSADGPASTSSSPERPGQGLKRKPDQPLSGPKRKSAFKPTALKLPCGRPARLPSDDFADAFLGRSGFHVVEAQCLSPVPLPLRHRNSESLKASDVREHAARAQGVSHQATPPTLLYNPFETFQQALSQRPSTSSAVLRPKARRLTCIPPVPRLQEQAPREKEGASPEEPAQRLRSLGQKQDGASCFMPYRQQTSQVEGGEQKEEQTMTRQDTSQLLSTGGDGQREKRGLKTPTCQAPAVSSAHPKSVQLLKGGERLARQKLAVPSGSSSGISRTAKPSEVTNPFRVRKERPLAILKGVAQALHLLRNPNMFDQTDDYTRALAQARAQLAPHLVFPAFRQPLSTQTPRLLTATYHNPRFQQRAAAAYYRQAPLDRQHTDRKSHIPLSPLSVAQPQCYSTAFCPDKPALQKS